MSITLTIEPPFRTALAAAGLRTFDDFLAFQPESHVISGHWNRRTFAFTLPVDGQPHRFFIKQLFRPQPEHVIGALLRARRPMCQPEHEWHNLIRLEQLGIGVMTRVAFGSHRVAGLPRRAFLIGREIPAPHTLDQWLCAAAVPETSRSTLLRAVGALARRLQDAGLLWRDIDSKHIFAAPIFAGGVPDVTVCPELFPALTHAADWKLWIVDVERIDTVNPEWLGLDFAASFAQALDPRFRFEWGRQPGPWDKQIYLGSLSVGAQESDAARSLMEFVEKMESTGTGCDELPSGAVRGSAVPYLRRANVQIHPLDEPLLADCGLLTFDALLSYSSGDALSKPGLGGWRTRNRVTLKAGRDASAVYYLKRFINPPLKEQWKRMISGHAKQSTAGREFRAIRRLARIGIPVPRCAAFAELMSMGGKGRREIASLLMLAEVPGASLESLVARAAIDRGVLPSGSQRHALTRRLARLIRRMHDHGYFHRDLYLAHVFADFSAADEPFTLIDLGRVIRRRRRLMRWRVKDLAALAYSSPATVISRTDRLRFIHAYLGSLPRPDAIVWHKLQRPIDAGPGEPLMILSQGPFGKSDSRQYIRAIEERCERMSAHDRKHGRRAHLLQAEPPK